MNIKLLLAYDGTHYLGWQKTKMGPSIEEALEKALYQILREEVSLQAASRTDAGVHARGQVVNFFLQREDLDFRKLQRGLNGVLPQEISVLHVEKAPDSFHPTVDSCGKEYHYLICYGPVQLPFQRSASWHFPYTLDLDKMRQGAQILVGTHDFRAFCNDKGLGKEDTIRTLRALEIDPLPGSRLRIRILGDRFLYKMARNLAGTLAYIGCGKLAMEELSALFQHKQRSRAGMTAPAHGLTLERVFYSSL